MALKVVRNKEYSMDEIADDIYMSDGLEVYASTNDTGPVVDDYNQDVYQGPETQESWIGDEYSQIPYHVVP